jgi:cysteine-rich repeat protein
MHREPQLRRRRSLTLLVVGLTLALGACGDDDGGGNTNDNQNQGDPVCGDGVVNGEEACDDGAENSDTQPDACRTDCRDPSCGDEVVDSGEQCDDGNNAGGDGCSADCLSDEQCGNGVVDASLGEECDDGNVDGGDGCGPQCTVEQCGNGIVDADEGCDDGNFLSHDGCSSGCTRERATWTDTGETVPHALQDAAVAVNPATGVTLFVGGRQVLTNLSSSVYEWDGQSWSSSGFAPDGVTAAAMVYDRARDRYVLFGGLCTGCGGGVRTLSDETWEYDGSGWSRFASLPSAPAARRAHAMVYDSRRGVTVLFGGCTRLSPVGNDCQEQDNETWEYDGTQWSLVPTTNAPSARSRMGMAYDAERGVTVMFGGIHHGGSLLDGTWEYDGADWVNVPGPEPEMRIGHRLVYDPIRRSVLCMMGTVDGDFPLGDLWELDGQGWTQLQPATLPTGRWSFGAVFDPLARGVWMMAGVGEAVRFYDDTWLLRTEASPPYPDEQCDNGADDDQDELVDCADPDCEGLPCGGGQTCDAGTCQ